jgi:hypothetical protein
MSKGGPNLGVNACLGMVQGCFVQFMQSREQTVPLALHTLLHACCEGGAYSTRHVDVLRLALFEPPGLLDAFLELTGPGEGWPRLRRQHKLHLLFSAARIPKGGGSGNASKMQALQLYRAQSLSARDYGRAEGNDKICKELLTWEVSLGECRKV